MNDIDPKRGAVIGAAYHLMQFMNTKVGHTRDWPVRIMADSPEREELARLLDETNKALETLIKCERNASSTRT